MRVETELLAGHDRGHALVSACGAWCNGPQAGEAGSGALALVVADERVDGGEVDGSRDVDCVKRAQSGLRERAGGGEQGVIEWEERDDIQ